MWSEGVDVVLFHLLQYLEMGSLSRSYTVDLVYCLCISVWRCCI